MGPKISKKDNFVPDPNVLDLIHVLTSATEFKLDMNSLATKIGIAQSKNVPRRINSVIGPYGYEFRGGKFVAKEDVMETATKADTEGAEGESEEKVEVKKKTSGAKAAASVTAKKGAKRPAAKTTKKRKVEDVATEDEMKSENGNEDEEDDETA